MPTRRGTSIERDNPFRPGGEIEKEAEDMLRSSTISGDRISVVDPNTPKSQRNSSIGGSTNSPEKSDGSEKVGASSDYSNSSVTHSVNTNGHTPDDHKGITTTDTTDDMRKDKNTGKKKKKKMCQIV